MKLRGVPAAIVALAGLVLMLPSPSMAADTVATGKIQITATVSPACTITGNDTSYLGYLDFSAPNTTTIDTNPKSITNGIVIDCNFATDVVLTSDNGAVRNSTPTTGVLKDYFHYAATVEVTDGAGFSCALDSFTDGTSPVTCPARLQPVNTEMRVTVAPDTTTGSLYPGSYSDVLTVTLLAD